MSKQTPLQRQSVVECGLVVLTTLFGMQLLRTLFSLLVNVLRDRLDWSAIQLGLLAFVIFLSAFLAALLRRLLTPRWALLATVGGVGLSRLVLQLWTGDPLGDLYLAIAGTVLFVLFLPIFLGHIRGRGAGLFALGLLLGLALDVAIHGVYGTYDVAWRSDIGSLILVLVLVAVQWWLLVSVMRAAEEGPSDSPWLLGLTWLGIGPLLFLELIIFDNLAWLNAHTGWNLPAGLAWALLSHAAGLGAAAWVLSRAWRRAWPLALSSGIVLILATAFTPPRDTAMAAGLMLLGQVSVALLLALITACLGSRSQGRGLARTTVAHGLGMILLVVLVFLYYAGIDMRLPFSAELVPPVGAAVLAVCGLGASLAMGAETAAMARAWLPALGALLLLVAPLAMLPAWRTPAATPGDGLPLRVLDYNLHNGFNTDGLLDLETLAQVIEGQNADIVGLQEVSRGWVIHGSADTLLWLSRRLQMPYVYGPTMGSLWGNAILSRYPILSAAEYELPPRDLLLLRGFILIEVDVGNGETLRVIDIHYHHVGEDSDIRVEHSQALLPHCREERTVVMGDFNAALEDPEIVMLGQAGLRDVCTLAGISPCFTASSVDPSKKIDYIWLSPDLNASDVDVLRSNASDHFPVVATIAR